MGKRTRSQSGFTLIEILIVLAVMAVLAAVVVPNVAGFLNRSKENAYRADRTMIQAAVDGWRSDTTQRKGNNWPVVASTSVISIPALVDSGYLRGTDAVGSASSAMTGATNSPTGSYTWTINTSTGVVSSDPAWSAGVYP